MHWVLCIERQQNKKRELFILVSLNEVYNVMGDRKSVTHNEIRLVSHYYWKTEQADTLVGELT